MVDKPLVARLKKEGPEVLIRKMLERNLTVLPVVDVNNVLVGEVRLKDLLRLRQDQVKSIESVVRDNSSTKMSCMLLISLLICKSEILKYCFITSSIVLSLESIVYIVLLMFSKFYW